jgi:hypothetical protein
MHIISSTREKTQPCKHGSSTIGSAHSHVSFGHDPTTNMARQRKFKSRLSDIDGYLLVQQFLPFTIL